MHCKVFMVKVSYEQKPYRRSMMHIWGASVIPSPSNETNAGRQMLAADPECPGSLGIAISEAVGGGRHQRTHEVHPGQRAEPRHAPSDRHRAGGREAVRSCARIFPTW